MLLYYLGLFAYIYWFVLQILFINSSGNYSILGVYPILRFPYGTEHSTWTDLF